MDMPLINKETLKYWKRVEKEGKCSPISSGLKPIYVSIYHFRFQEMFALLSLFCKFLFVDNFSFEAILISLIQKMGRKSHLIVHL